MVIANLPHLDIRDWLQRLELLDYEENFRKFPGVEDLISFSESDIKNLGVKNSSHRARIISSIVALKGKENSLNILTEPWNLNPFESLKFVNIFFCYQTQAVTKYKYSVAQSVTYMSAPIIKS